MKKRNKKIIAALSAIFGLLVIGALCWSFVLCYRTLHPPRLTDLSWLTRQYPHTTCLLYTSDAADHRMARQHPQQRIAA